jgi:hypothetical protein
MAIKVRAVKEVWYEGRTRQPGDEFDCADIDAAILCAADISGGPKTELIIKSGKPIPSISKEDVAPLLTSDLVAESDNTTQPDDAPRKRTYRRRDMIPEE